MENTLTYLGAIIVAWFMATGDRPMQRTVLALLGAFFVQALYTQATVLATWMGWLAYPSYSPWALFIATDTAAAFIILRHPAKIWQAFIGVCFVVQIALHAGYGFRYLENGYDYEIAVQHWVYVQVLGYIKLFLLLAWGGWNVVARSYRSRRDHVRLGTADRVGA